MHLLRLSNRSANRPREMHDGIRDETCRMMIYAETDSRLCESTLDT